MTTIQTTACDLHFPHKEWADDPYERQNYLELERWAYQFRTGCPNAQTEGVAVAIGQSSACDLHIPHKEWSGDERERQNYLEMERWAYYFRTHCCAGGLGALGLPESPPILMDKVIGTDYCSAITAPQTLEDNVRFDRTVTFTSPGITFDQPLGPGIPVQPYTYTSSYYADAVHFFFPPVRNLRIHLKFHFSETTITSPYDVEVVTRGLHIKLVRTSDLVNLGDVYQNYTGTRLGPVVAQLDVGPLDMPDPFTMHAYCLWNSVHSGAPGQHNNTTYFGTDGLTVTGVL